MYTEILQRNFKNIYFILHFKMPNHCTLYPWRWSNGWPKHVWRHCMYRTNVYTVHCIYIYCFNTCICIFCYFVQWNNKCTIYYTAPYCWHTYVT